MDQEILDLKRQIVKEKENIREEKLRLHHVHALQKSYSDIHQTHAQAVHTAVEYLQEDKLSKE